jgi:uncharacterized protein YndB with AHSA1/START domain
MSGLSLMVRRTIRASPERLFAAWTEPEQLRRWWGPAEVECAVAEVDLRVGGRYRLANKFPDGSIWWIEGTFETVAPPHLLIYSWELSPPEIATGGASAPARRSERVTVRFEPHGDATDVTIIHERIADETARFSHEKGWRGCLDGLTELLRRSG